MSRRTAPLTAEHLALIDAPAARCLFWELDPVRREWAGEQAARLKQEWVRATSADWGVCGQTVLLDDLPVGFLSYAPEALLPGSAGFPTAPIATDAVLLAGGYVDPAHRGRGWGRVLIQAMARDLVLREAARAVETFASPAGARSPLAETEGPLLPIGFLERTGFGIVRPHPLTPRLRLDLRTTVTWRDGVEAALEGLLGAIRPRPKAARPPSPEATRAGVTAVRTVAISR